MSVPPDQRPAIYRPLPSGELSPDQIATAEEAFSLVHHIFTGGIHDETLWPNCPALNPNELAVMVIEGSKVPIYAVGKRKDMEEGVIRVVEQNERRVVIAASREPRMAASTVVNIKDKEIWSGFNGDVSILLLTAEQYSQPDGNGNCAGGYVVAASRTKMEILEHHHEDTPISYIIAFAGCDGRRKNLHNSYHAVAVVNPLT